LNLESSGQVLLPQENVGQLFEISTNAVDFLNLKTLLPSRFIEQVNTLRECVCLYRKQTSDVCEKLREIDFVAPASPLRVVLWGKFGTGKTMTLHQLSYFAHLQNFIIITVKDVMQLTRPNLTSYDVQLSSFKPGRMDTPKYAISLLKMFKHQNQTRWQELTKLKTTRLYEWSKLESTPEGRPIVDIVELGLSAPYLATDCLGGLFRELRFHATSRHIKLLLAIDHANSLYGRTTIKRPDRTIANAEELTVVHQLRKMLKPTWSNGLCALVADKTELCNARDPLTIPLNSPLDVFGEHGLNEITPFATIKTELYSEIEANTMYKYYCDRKWLTTKKAQTEEGRKQLFHLSAYNPHYYERLCAFN